MIDYSLGNKEIRFNSIKLHLIATMYGIDYRYNENEKMKWKLQESCIGMNIIYDMNILKKVLFQLLHMRKLTLLTIKNIFEIFCDQTERRKNDGQLRIWSHNKLPLSLRWH